VLPLKFNQVLLISEDGVEKTWRILAPAKPENGINVMVFIPDSISQWKKSRLAGVPVMLLRRISNDEIEALDHQGVIKPIFLEPQYQYRKMIGELKASHQKVFKHRSEVMKRFLDTFELGDTLLRTGAVHLLVREAMLRCKVSEKHVYDLFHRLCWFGLEAGSLNPSFHRCGAPGKPRPWNEGMKKVGAKPLPVKLGLIESDPQIGMTAAEVLRIVDFFNSLRDPKLNFEVKYLAYLEKYYVQNYILKDDKRVPVPPGKGMYPTKKQIKYALKSHFSEIELLRQKLYVKEYLRNYRGLKGHSWEGIAGPGHRYAIDATIGDIYLRSRINAAWIIGRPIVYFIVDIKSTAIVGFHVCLEGPSWKAAMSAIFSMLNPELVADLWGLEHEQVLYPAPSLPYEFICDRGEFLSKASQETAQELSYQLQYNPAYRPELKSSVEVIHRIEKDAQYPFIPGAIDSRKRAVEARVVPEDGVFTIVDFVEFIAREVKHHNLHSSRDYLMTDDMIGLGVEPTPSGIWKNGHEQMMGYGKETSFAKTVAHFLPAIEATVTKKGIYLGALEYRLPFENDWSAYARNFGYFKIDVHYFHGSLSKVFWINKDDPEGTSVVTLELSPHALADAHLTTYEWLDARSIQKINAGDRIHLAVISKLEKMAATKDQVTLATEVRDAAKATSEVKINPSEARRLERDIPQSSLILQDIPIDLDSEDSDAWDREFDNLMAMSYGTPGEHVGGHYG
jgi:putative transposase